MLILIKTTFPLFARERGILIPLKLELHVIAFYQTPILMYESYKRLKSCCVQKYLKKTLMKHNIVSLKDVTVKIVSTVAWFIVVPPYAVKSLTANSLA